MSYTIKDIKNSLPDYKKKKEPLWCKLLLRRVSYYLTYIFINLNWTPNMVSVLSCFIAIFGSAFLCINNTFCITIGVLMINIWSILDCVDGNMARCLKKASLAGEFFDAVGGYTISAFIMVGVSMAGYYTTELFSEYKIYLILIGCLGGVCDILGRLIYQKYSNVMMRMEYKRIGESGIQVENDYFYENNHKNSSIKRLSLYVDYEFGVGGNEPLFLILAMIINRIDLFVILYSVYHVIGYLVVFVMYINKMSHYEHQYL